MQSAIPCVVVLALPRARRPANQRLSPTCRDDGRPCVASPCCPRAGLAASLFHGSLVWWLQGHADCFWRGWLTREKREEWRKKERQTSTEAWRSWRRREGAADTLRRGGAGGGGGGGGADGGGEREGRTEGGRATHWAHLRLQLASAWRSSLCSPQPPMESMWRL